MTSRASFRFMKCLFGPKLFKAYASSGKKAVEYVPSGPEKLGDGILRLINWSLQLGIYTSPFVIWILYKKDYFCYEGLQVLMHFAALSSLLYASSLTARAFGRLSNPDYMVFLNHLETAHANYNSSAKKLLLKYDFDFSAWPVDFDANKIDRKISKPQVFVSLVNKTRSVSNFAKVLPCRIISYLVAHTIGIRLLYPGTIIQHFIEPHLVDGRTRLIEKFGGERHKLLTRDGNIIDCISIDRRGSSETNGNVLVICCEGNAGFYEVGMIGTPLEAGYSVLGWNHPGFGGSSGSPYPRHEQSAVDVVMQFALIQLKFSVESIILYGWSIGGFSASWAAMNYPNVRAVMLDATFDHVFPLAANVMPSSWKSVVASTVKYELNLNVAEQLIKYPGPVLLFRRMRDEVIALEPGTLSTNRGNDLLIKLLKFRYPHVTDSVTIPVLKKWLSADSEEREEMTRNFEVSSALCLKLFKQYVDDNSDSFPMLIGQNWTEDKKIQLALVLANRYMLDFDSTHCTPLPVEMFRSPQEIGLEADLVKLRNGRL